jgi:putative flippase GtrA
MFNFGFSSIFLSITIGMGLNPQIAKIIATGLQMIWTYIAYKKVVFT